MSSRGRFISGADFLIDGGCTAFLLGEHARFITGTDLLIDGGVIAAIRTGEYQLG